MQVNSQASKITESDEIQEYPVISEVKKIVSSIPEININCFLKDETHMLTTNSLHQFKELNMTDPGTWTDTKITQHIQN